MKSKIAPFYSLQQLCNEVCRHAMSGAEESGGRKGKPALQIVITDVFRVELDCA